MTNYSHEAFAAAPFPSNQRALTAASLWLRLGFVGLLVCAGAVTTLAEGWAHALAAIAAIVAGGWLTVFSWGKAHATLLRVDALGSDLPPVTLHHDVPPHFSTGHSANATAAHNALAPGR